ncbi:hypothetical protein CDL12_30371 [Handroanthus impetiginosus]|uniref:Uncharacterized protein n=1 Tax=Handroanthus impetiginosus TaxID=429701 RepID=A0A2G9FW54_9LAMI|nr:hypothetical protein CDL12_30371 [Handroanthus impetiginosus]
MGRSSATVPASLSHRPASEGPPTSKVRSGSPAGKQAWEPMKDVMNPSDPGTLGDYTSDQLLDLGAGDLVSPEVEKRWFDENGKSKEELAQKPSRRDFSKEKYNRDDKHRRRPLESAPRKNQMENPRADVVSRFKDSDKFKNAMMDAAADIYEQTLQECRRILRETGRIAEEDLLLMDPNLPTNFNAQGVIEGAADVEDDMEDDMEDDISPLS